MDHGADTCQAALGSPLGYTCPVEIKLFSWIEMSVSFFAAGPNKEKSCQQLRAQLASAYIRLAKEHTQFPAAHPSRSHWVLSGSGEKSPVLCPQGWSCWWQLDPVQTSPGACSACVTSVFANGCRTKLVLASWKLQLSSSCRCCCLEGICAPRTPPELPPSPGSPGPPDSTPRPETCLVRTGACKSCELFHLVTLQEPLPGKRGLKHEHKPQR